MKFLMQIFPGRGPRSLVAAVRGGAARASPPTTQRLNEIPGVTSRRLARASPRAATTVRVERGRHRNTDGRLNETKEALGGYFMFEGDDLDAAIAVAARVPATRFGGAVEIRPLVQYS